MSHLPTELVFAILEHGYYLPTGSPDYALLSNCALVCRSWSGPAQSLLFSKTTPLLARAAIVFEKALVSSAAREASIGRSVRSLNISIGVLLDHGCQLDTLASILEACPLLYELNLGIYGLHELDQFALAKLKHGGQGIRALNIHSCGVQSPLLFQLLRIWPRIRFLKIGTEIAAWPWRSQGSVPVFRPSRSNGATAVAGAYSSGDNAQAPSPAALYDLALSRIPPPAVLTWLLGSSTKSLRILDLREGPGREAGEMFAIHAPHLRSLRMIHFNMDSATLVSQCTNLKEFVIYTIPSIVPLAPVLPPTIEHLSFRNPTHASRRTLVPILDAIKVLPKLRIITCDKESERLRDFRSLKRICAERGIEITISEVPVWMYDDPIMVRRFPRRRSVSNFGLMTRGRGRD